MERPVPDRLHYLRLLGIAALVVVLVADLLTRHKAHFEQYGLLFDTYAWFYPALGFGATVALVIVARAAAIFLVREDHYYGAE